MPHNGEWPLNSLAVGMASMATNFNKHQLPFNAPQWGVASKAMNFSRHQHSRNASNWEMTVKRLTITKILAKNCHQKGLKNALKYVNTNLQAPKAKYILSTYHNLATPDRLQFHHLFDPFIRFFPICFERLRPPFSQFACWKTAVRLLCQVTSDLDLPYTPFFKVLGHHSID